MTAAAIAAAYAGPRDYESAVALAYARGVRDRLGVRAVVRAVCGRDPLDRRPRFPPAGRGAGRPHRASLPFAFGAARDDYGDSFVAATFRRARGDFGD